MSRKKAARKRPNRPATALRRPSASAAPEVADVEAPLHEPSTAAAPAGVQRPVVPTAAPPLPGTRRGVGRIGPGAAAGRRERTARPGSWSAGFEPLDPADPAIPYDRVPYVPADLRRVALIAGAMIVLIVVADLIVSHVVK